MSTDEKPTIELAAPPDWAVKLTEKVVGVSNEVRASREESSGRFDRLEGTVTGLVGDARGLHERLTGIEGRVARIESPSTPPLAPLTSERVGALVDARASQMSLEQEAKIGKLLAAKDEEIAKLKKESATKDDLADALDKAAKVQTEAIVAGVQATIATIAKTPTAKRLTSAILPVLLLAIAAIGLKLQATVSRLQQPTQQSTVVQMSAPNAPITDAGADR